MCWGEGKSPTNKLQDTSSCCLSRKASCPVIGVYITKRHDKNHNESVSCLPACPGSKSLSPQNKCKAALRIQMSSDASFSKGKGTVEIHILIGSIVMQWKNQRQANFSVFARTGKSIKVIDEEVKQNAMRPPLASARSSNIWNRSTSYISTLCPGKGMHT